jgi:TctA family transporter
MSTYTLDITPDVYPQPGEITTNAAYLAYVVNRAAESYATQYGAASKEDGITAAREAYNASMPPAQEPAE